MTISDKIKVDTTQLLIERGQFKSSQAIISNTSFVGSAAPMDFVWVAVGFRHISL